jgi:hypothetical protein
VVRTTQKSNNEQENTVIRFLVNQYKLSCRAGFGRRKAMARAVRTYRFGF